VIAGRRLIAAAGLVAVAAALAACGSGSTSGADSGRLDVVTTTTQLADFTRNVGGNRVAVRQLLKPNVDPHDYEPTPGDVAAVSSADVLVEHGIGLDTWLEPVVDNAGGDALPVVATTGVPLLGGDSSEPDGDPHVWLDPRNAVTMVRNIEKGLAAADPDGAAAYRANADRYVARIEAFDRELAARIDAVPAAKRKIVTDHDAFGYFAKRYGITVVGTVIPSLSTAAEPSAGDVTRLVSTIRREGVRVVFSESSVDPRLQRAIAKESGATLGAPLYGDSLGPADQPAGTYLGMMRANMDAIVAGINS